MSEVKHDDWLPTIQFGFLLDSHDKHILHQMWVTPMGLTEWRPVPMIELGQQRKPSVAGYLGDDDE
jgi:hypothetical protein